MTPIHTKIIKLKIALKKVHLQIWKYSHNPHPYWKIIILEKHTYKTHTPNMRINPINTKK